MHSGRAGFFEQVQGLTGDAKRGHTLLARNDLNIVPGNFPAPSRLQRFQEGFLCREPPGVGLCGGGAFRIAVSAFGVGEYAFAKPRGSCKRFGDAIDFDDVDSDGEDHKK